MKKNGPIKSTCNISSKIQILNYWNFFKHLEKCFPGIL
jgi:hypothetical protein